MSMKFQNLRILPLLAILFVACSEDKDLSNGEGTINADVTMTRLVTAAPDWKAGTRADSEPTENGTFEAMAVDESELDLIFTPTSGTGAPYSCKYTEFDPAKKTFPVGSYKVEVKYGSATAEGFERPYYYGSTNVTVQNQSETPANLVATVQNTLVKVGYTDAFKTYFSQYTTTIQSTGGVGVVFVKDEEREAYVRPGNISITLNLVRADAGDGASKEIPQLQVSPIANAQPGALYRVKLDVNNGEVGKPQLVVTFIGVNPDDREVIDIDLSDESLNADPPVIATEGFDPTTPIEIVEGEGSEVSPKFEITALAGLKSVQIITNAPAWAALSGKELVGADAGTVESLKNLGLRAKGLWEASRDKMAVLDFGEAVKQLRANSGEEGSTYKFTVKVVDNYSKTPEDGDKELTVNVSKFVFTATPTKTLEIGENSATLLLETNSQAENLQDCLSFTTPGVDGRDVVCPITAFTEAAGTRMIASKAYNVVITLPAVRQNHNVTVNVKYRDGSNGDIKVPILRREPEYSLDNDNIVAMSKRAVISIVSDEDLTEKLKTSRVYISNNDGATYTIAREGGQYEYDAQYKRILVKRLTPNKNYKVCVAIVNRGEKEDVAIAKHVVSFTTDAAAEVPNGDFENVTNTINKTIDQGGTWTITLGGTKYQTTLTMNVNEPAGWSSYNNVTCNLGASNLNSWYCVPSTYSTDLSWVSNQPNAKFVGVGQDAYTSTADVYKNFTAQSGSKAVVIRNVAYDHAGASIPNNNQTGNSSHSNYYCDKVPSVSKRTAGKLFLGTWTENLNEQNIISNTSGVAFTATPTALTGYYQYTLDSQDDASDTDKRALVSVRIMSGDKEVAIGERELAPTAAGSGFVPFTVMLRERELWEKPTTLKILITSSKYQDESKISTTNYCNKEEQISRGAQLIVDNLKFSYSDDLN